MIRPISFQVLFQGPPLFNCCQAGYQIDGCVKCPIRCVRLLNGTSCIKAAFKYVIVNIVVVVPGIFNYFTNYPVHPFNHHKVKCLASLVSMLFLFLFYRMSRLFTLPPVSLLSFTCGLLPPLSPGPVARYSDHLVTKS